MEYSPSSDLARVFGQLSDQLRDGRGTQAVYDALVRAAVQAIDGCDHASVLVEDRGRFYSAAATDSVALRIDELEREVGEGPCLDAIVEESFQHDPDLTVEPTWPRLAERAMAETPVRSMLAFRLAQDGRKSGALDIFSDTPGSLNDESIDQAAVLAAFASVAISAAVERERADNLKIALDSNREIGKAIGILMAAHKLTDEQAFDVLKRASQDLNRKLSEIASEYVARSGTSPEA